MLALALAGAPGGVLAAPGAGPSAAAQDAGRSDASGTPDDEGSAGGHDDEVSPLVGRAAPGFALPRLGGGRVNLAELAGRPVVLGFWATWCGPCRGELAALERMRRRLGAAVAVVMVSIDNAEAWSEVVPALVKREGWGMTFAHDDGKTSTAYGVEGIPALFVIDRRGRVVHHHLGFDEDFEARLERELAALR